MKKTPIKPTLQPLQQSHWGGDRSRVHPKLLPVQFGDGKKPVIVLFYHAPEVEILVRFDSQVPLDLPDRSRFLPDHTRPESFRDYLDEIYELCEQHISIRKSWARVIEAGSTWCHQ